MTSVLTARLGTPRLVVRTLVATFGAILLILAAVFVVLSIETRNTATRTVTSSLQSTERIFAALEESRRERLGLQQLNLASSPELGNALFLFQTSTDPEVIAVPALQRELQAVAPRLGGATVFVVDSEGAIVASAGPHRHTWARGQAAGFYGGAPTNSNSEQLVDRPAGLFRVRPVPATALNSGAGVLYLATVIDDNYAAELAMMAQAHVAITLDRQLLASTLPHGARSELRRLALADRLPAAGLVDLDGERYATRSVLPSEALRIHVLDSVDVFAHQATREAVDMLAFVGVGALLLGGAASFWLARSVARPIDGLSRQLRLMARARDFARPLPATGSSRELDALTATFNELIHSVGSAEAQIELAYVGAIKALAAALDCRDPYTAGHSERVSALSVMIGRQMQLETEELDVLRLGALLHDIGKIGIRDNVLTKAGPLTAEEFEIIKTHPTLGGHILRQIPFLTKHLSIVELHHERPDGRGYPRGLLGHATPLLARIVHVADAFDAMTTARAYRPAQTPGHAVAELWRFAGSQFDAEVVEAFVAAWSAVSVSEGQSEVAVAMDRSGAVLPFPARISEAG